MKQFALGVKVGKKSFFDYCSKRIGLKLLGVYAGIIEHIKAPHEGHPEAQRKDDVRSCYIGSMYKPTKQDSCKSEFGRSNLAPIAAERAAASAFSKYQRKKKGHPTY